MDYDKLNSLLSNLKVKPEGSAQSQDKTTLKEESNDKLNEYKHNQFSVLPQNKQMMASQVDFRTFMDTSGNKSEHINKNTINDKLFLRDKITTLNPGPNAIMDMKPQSTRDIKEKK